MNAGTPLKLACLKIESQSELLTVCARLPLFAPGVFSRWERAVLAAEQFIVVLDNFIDVFLFLSAFANSQLRFLPRLLLTRALADDVRLYVVTLLMKIQVVLQLFADLVVLCVLVARSAGLGLFHLRLFTGFRQQHGGLGESQLRGSFSETLVAVACKELLKCAARLAGGFALCLWYDFLKRFEPLCLPTLHFLEHHVLDFHLRRLKNRFPELQHIRLVSSFHLAVLIVTIPNLVKVVEHLLRAVRAFALRGGAGQ